ncbi:MAG: hypothetical protein LBL83_01075 [Clostridiales bacterium]|jgi:hypothetical protein|nr:hypothetical protein [Clostridiales bacterium]
MDLQKKAFYLALKWMELTQNGVTPKPTDFAEEFVAAHQDILRVLSDHEPPESFDASSFM